MKRTHALIASLALGLAGCAADNTGSADARNQDGRRADIPVARVTGEPVNCLPIQSLRQSVVRDDWTIDFRTGANTWYRNALPRRCNGLGFEQAFAYGTSLTQLCNVDIITVIARNGGPGAMNRGSCGLGMFTPVELAE